MFIPVVFLSLGRPVRCFLSEKVGGGVATVPVEFLLFVDDERGGEGGGSFFIIALFVLSWYW